MRRSVPGNARTRLLVVVQPLYPHLEGGQSSLAYKIHVVLSTNMTNFS